MTRDDDFIQRLESYLDDYEGVTPLPDAVRKAVRAELPNTKQVGPHAGPTRYLTMIMNKTGPVALAAAAAILAVAAGAFLLSSRNVGVPDASPSVTAQPSPEACSETTARVTGSGGGTIEVVWCAYGPGEPGAIAFTMEGPSEWVDQYFPGQNTLWLRPEGGGAITLFLAESQSVDELIVDITGRPEYVIDNRESVTLDDAAGEVFDVSLAPGTPSNEAPPLIEDPDQSWQVQQGTTTRVWVVDVNGQTLMIATGEDLAEAVGQSLETLAWVP